MNNTFNEDYAKYYNLLYKDKNYIQEVKYINSLIKKHCPSSKSILELGCGTGRHAKLLQEESYEVFGVDASRYMINQAKCLYIPSAVGDVRYYRHKHTFDTVLSLFHVASYQVSEEDILLYFKTATTHLNPKQRSLFIFDFWYKPAVLHLLPEQRTKTVEDDSTKIIRSCIPNHLPEKNIVEITYNIEYLNKEKNVSKNFCEKHIMRYFSLEEIKKYAKATDIEIIVEQEWLTGKKLVVDTWSACCVGTKI